MSGMRVALIVLHSRLTIPWSHRNSSAGGSVRKNDQPPGFKPGRLAGEYVGLCAMTTSTLRWINASRCGNLCGLLILYCIYEPSIVYRRFYSFTRLLDGLVFQTCRLGFILISLAAFHWPSSLDGCVQLLLSSAPVADGNAESGTGPELLPKRAADSGVLCSYLAMLAPSSPTSWATRALLWRSRFSVHPATDAGITCFLLLGFGFLLAFVWNTLVLLRRTTHAE